HGKFANDRSLSKEERQTLLSWIEQGSPRGDDKDLPAPKRFAEGWTIGQPDAVFTMPQEYTVPARAGRGGIPYQHFIVSKPFTEDTWVQAAEARPGNRAVVHHIIVYVFKLEEIKKKTEDGIGRGFLVGFAPGDLGVTFPPGSAKKIAKGSVLV